MSLELYKQLNEELIKKVQEQKMYIEVLQKDAREANANFFNCHQRRIEEKGNFLQIINELKTSFGLAFERAILEVQTDGYIEDVDDVEAESERINSEQQQQRLSLAEVRRRSSGVTIRSPLRTVSPQQNIINAEQAAISDEMAAADENIERLNGAVNYDTINLGKIAECSENSNDIEENRDQENNSNLIESNDEIYEINDQENNCDLTKSNTLEIPKIRVESRRDTRVFTNTVLRPTEQNMTSLASIVATNNSMERLTINFDEQLCLHSTPRSTINLTEKEVSSNTTKAISDGNETLTSSRPRRRCSPSVLTEPSLQGKLRNDGQAKKRQKKKKKT